MTDAQFYKSFCFQVYTFNRYHATDNSQGSPQHYFAKLIRGTAKICTDTEALHLKAGDIFYIPRGLPYHSYWYLDAGGENAFFSFGFDHLPAEDRSYRLQIIDANEEERALFAMLERKPTISPESIGYLYHFFGAVAGKMPTQAATRSKTVDRALHFMQTHDRYTARDIAADCGMSESGLYAAFKKHLGKTPNEMRHRLLVDRAVELLSTTDLSVEEISDRLGFSSSSYFRKVLKAETGCSPRDVRRRAQTV